MFCAQCGQWMADGEASCSRCGAALHAGAAVAAHAATPAATPAISASAAPRYAGFWRRFATVLVDGLVLFFPSAILRVALGLSVLGTGNESDRPAFWLAFFANIVMTWLYCSALESSPAQGSLGQQLLGVRVCDGSLRRISFGRATGRHLAQWLSVLICGIGYLVNLWTSRRQALHDLVAGCVLVRAESLSPATPPAAEAP
jgi:uncharacterized RDD family membrane protein YckC